MNMPVYKLLDVPPVWLAAFAALVWALGGVFPAVGPGWLRPIGNALVIGGVSVILLAALQFRQHRTSIIPHQEANVLLTSGLYAWSRNPIYLADAVILTGLCLRWGVLPGLLLVLIFGWVIRKRFILPEEKRLAARFGATFDAYCTKTRRWL